MRYLLVLALACSSIADDEIVAKAKKLSIREHADLVRKLGLALGNRLLKPDPKLAVRLPKGVSVNRILNRGLFGNELGVRGGGAYFSFVRKSNDYNHAPNIELQQWKFSSGFAGSDFGLVKFAHVGSLAKVTVENLPDLLKLPANQFYKDGRDHWRTLWQQQKQQNAQGPLEPPNPPAEVGRVYVVRSVLWSNADVLAAFQVLEKDEFGVTIAWKVLKNFPNPGRRR